jgi:hypothetical protein
MAGTNGTSEKDSWEPERPWMENWLDQYKKYRTIGATCMAMNLGRSTVHRWLKRSKEFKKRFVSLRHWRADNLEATAFQLADGYQEPVFQGGQQVGMVKKYPIALIIFLLKANKSEKYHLEKKEAEVNAEHSAARAREALREMRETIPLEEGDG